MSWWGIAAASVGAGLLGAMGLGGGGVLLLVLVSAGMGQLAAQGVNLFVIVPVGLLGLYFHYKNGLLEWKTAWPLLLGGIPGVLGGFWLAGYLSEETLQICFGILVILLALRELRMGIGLIRDEGWRLLAKKDEQENG